MPQSPTTGAPTSFKELEDLLQQDTKVKVAGKCSRLSHLLSTSYHKTRRGHITDKTGIDEDGVLRGKIMSKSKFLSAVKTEGFGFCSVIFGWDSEL